jgi:succinate dehydrogenase flavin-adding protein (antitoxin of CptAB toxin-antitoxin module)
MSNLDGPKGLSFDDVAPVTVKDLVEQRGFREQDLFNNPFVDAAKKSMSLEQIENFKKMGEKYFSVWDFDKGNPEEILDVAVAELSEAIKSGLHPTDLEENDIAILSTKLGKDWYKRFGYEEEDLKRVRV